MAPPSQTTDLQGELVQGTKFGEKSAKTMSETPPLFVNCENYVLPEVEPTIPVVVVEPVAPPVLVEKEMKATVVVDQQDIESIESQVDLVIQSETEEKVDITEKLPANTELNMKQLEKSENSKQKEVEKVLKVISKMETTEPGAKKAKSIAKEFEKDSKESKATVDSAKNLQKEIEKTKKDIKQITGSIGKKMKTLETNRKEMSTASDELKIKIAKESKNLVDAIDEKKREKNALVAKNKEQVEEKSKLIEKNANITKKAKRIVKEMFTLTEKPELLETEKNLDNVIKEQVVVMKDCTCDFNHSFTQLGKFVSVEKEGKKECVGYVSYKINDETLLGVGKCAPKRNSCENVTFDFKSSKCDFKPLSSIDMSTSLANIF